MSEQNSGPRFLDDLAQTLGNLLPGSEPPAELKRSVDILLQSALARLDLVTREEFDAQTAVLARTRQKLETLEAQLATLEKP